MQKMIALFVSAYLTFFQKTMHTSYSNQNGSYLMKKESSQESNDTKVYVEFFVPQSVVGVIIGKGGSMRKKIEEQLDVKLFIDNIGEVQTMIGIYGPEGGVHNATEMIMKLLLSLRTIQTKLNNMGKPATLRYVEEMTFLSSPKAGRPTWFVNLDKERIQLENGDKKMPKQVETAKTDRTESHSEEVFRGSPMLNSPAPPVEPQAEKLTKSKSKASPCLFKVKVVPKTESGLPDDRYETEAIALSVRTPVNYSLMVGTLRAGVENLPENYNLFIKIDNEWTKIPRPKNNANDATIWEEYFVNQPKASQVLYLVDMPKAEKTKQSEERSTTKLMHASIRSDACEPWKMQEKVHSTTDSTDSALQLQELVDINKALKLDAKRNKALMKHYEKYIEEQNQQIKNLETEKEAESRQIESLEVRIAKFGRKLKEKDEKLGQLEKNHQLVKEVLECTVCFLVKKKVVFCEGCRHFTCCVGCARSMRRFECPVCRAGWSAELDRKMGMWTNVFQNFDCIENYPETTVTTSTEILNNNPLSSNRSEQNLPRLVGPTLAVNPPTCTVPAAGGQVIFELVNSSPERLAFVVECANARDYVFNVYIGFVKPGRHTSLMLTRKAGQPNKDELFIYYVVAAPDVADSADAFLTATSVGCVKVPVSATT